MYDAEWTSERPCEPGMYWFYGRKFVGSPRKSLYFVEVWQGASGLVFVIGGHFFDDAATTDGVWTVAHVPNTPSGEPES